MENVTDIYTYGRESQTLSAFPYEGPISTRFCPDERGYFKAFLSDLSRPSRRYGTGPGFSRTSSDILPVFDEFKLADGIRQAGWHARDSMIEALRVSGVWSDGKPCRLFRLEIVPGVPVVAESCLREDMSNMVRFNAATWKIVEEIAVQSLCDYIAGLLIPGHANELAATISQAMGDLVNDRTRPRSRSSNDVVAELLEHDAHLHGIAWDLFDSRLTETELDASGKGEAVSFVRDMVFEKLLDLSAMRKTA